MNNSNQMEIDLFFLLKKLWMKKFLIAFVSILFATLALITSVVFIPPIYTAKTSFYVGHQKNQGDLITAQDLQAGDYLVKDYKEIIMTKTVSQEVVDSEKLSISADELLGKIKLDLPTNTRIIYISVNDKSPQEAARLANAYRVVAAKKIKDVTNIDNVKDLATTTR